MHNTGCRGSVTPHVLAQIVLEGPVNPNKQFPQALPTTQAVQG